MKKLALIIFLTILFLPSLFARNSGDKYIGLSSGYVYSTINTDTGYKTGQSYLPGHGFSISIPVIFQVHDNIGLETGIEFLQKNFTSKYIATSLNEVTELYEKNINSYIELPLSMSLTFSHNSLSTSLGFGGYCGFWLSSYREGKALGSSISLDETKGFYGYYSGYHDFNERYDNRYSFGLLFRSSLEYRLNRTVLMLRLSYKLGLSDMRKGQKYFSTKMRNNALTAEVGIMYNFGGAK